MAVMPGACHGELECCRDNGIAIGHAVAAVYLPPRYDRDAVIIHRRVPFVFCIQLLQNLLAVLVHPPGKAPLRHLVEKSLVYSVRPPFVNKSKSANDTELAQ